MSISVLDALRSFKKPAIIGLVGLIAFITAAWVSGTVFSNDSPVQPIEFSHRIHAGDNGIPCQYCHVQASRSPSAGVPSVAKCAGCHTQLPAVRDKPEIVKVLGYWERREPIPWVKVHDVPDFVHFTHKRHIQAGLDCAECHGDIASMDRIKKVEPLDMPFCVDCHTAKEVANGRDCWTCHK